MVELAIAGLNFLYDAFIVTCVVGPIAMFIASLRA